MPRYHIDGNDEVVKCSAWIRSCKFKDYATEKEAKEALLLKKASEEYEADLAYVQKKFSIDSARSVCLVDFSGMNRKNTLRKYMNKLDQEFYSQGKSPDLFSVRSQVRQSNISTNSSSFQRAEIVRTPIPDYKNAVVKSEWKLNIIPIGMSVVAGDGIVYDLDLHNNFQVEMDRAERILRETVIANMGKSPRMTMDDIDYEAKFMVDQLGLAYSTIEELDTDRGSFVSWNTAEGYGNFAKTDITNLLVNVNYQTSSFNSRIFHDFIHTNPYYEARFPDPIDVRVFDNELGQCDNSWTIRCTRGLWRMFAQIGDQMYVEDVKNPQLAYETMRDFIKNNMLTNDDETVEEKAVFIRDLVSGVSDSIQSFVKWKEENPLY